MDSTDTQYYKIQRKKTLITDAFIATYHFATSITQFSGSSWMCNDIYLKREKANGRVVTK